MLLLALLIFLIRGSAVLSLVSDDEVDRTRLKYSTWTVADASSKNDVEVDVPMNTVRLPSTTNEGVMSLENAFEEAHPVALARTKDLEQNPLLANSKKKKKKNKRAHTIDSGIGRKLQSSFKLKMLWEPQYSWPEGSWCL